MGRSTTSATRAELGRGPVSPTHKGRVYVSDADSDIVTVSVTICHQSTHCSCVVYSPFYFPSLYVLPSLYVPLTTAQFTNHHCPLYTTSLYVLLILLCVLSLYILLCMVLCFAHCWYFTNSPYTVVLFLLSTSFLTAVHFPQFYYTFYPPCCTSDSPLLYT